MGNFPQNFRSPLAPKLLVRLKNLGGCKNGTDILYLHAKFGGDPPLLKSWEFFCLFITLWNLNRGICHSNSDIVAICRSHLTISPFSPFLEKEMLF